MVDIKWISKRIIPLATLVLVDLHMKRGGYAASHLDYLPNHSILKEAYLGLLVHMYQKLKKEKHTTSFLMASTGEEEFDFAMLIPPFAGVGSQSLTIKMVQT